MDAPSMGETFLTERQTEVLSARQGGAAQREIADRIDTSVANVSAIESTARENVGKARRTLTLARLLGAAVRFRVDSGTDLRELVDRVFDAGDENEIRIAYTDPELAAHLRTHLADRLADRELTEAVVVGIASDGDVATHPSTVLPDADDMWVDGTG